MNGLSGARQCAKWDRGKDCQIGCPRFKSCLALDTSLCIAVFEFSCSLPSSLPFLYFLFIPTYWPSWSLCTEYGSARSGIFPTSLQNERSNNRPSLYWRHQVQSASNSAAVCFTLNPGTEHMPLWSLEPSNGSSRWRLCNAGLAWLPCPLCLSFLIFEMGVLIPNSQSYDN